MELSHLKSRRLESGIVGISMQRKEEKNKTKKAKEGVNSMVLLGKEEEEKKERSEENEGKKRKWRRDLVMLCGFTTPNIDNESRLLCY